MNQVINDEKQQTA